MQVSNLVGQTLGNYRLLSSLGKGGYAEVYLAEHAHLSSKEKYAVKVLKTPDLESYQQDEFRDEANLMAKLIHRHIAQVRDYGFHTNIPYLVMEYASGGTLRKVYGRGTMVPFQQIVLYVKQMAAALQFAHEQEPCIVHRDVKPENMLVRGPDDIILSDFGIAIAGLNTGNLQQQQEALIRKMARNEHVMVPGTASYVAPERLQGKTQRASDQYSLAIVVYEWLCGRRPFTGTDAEICQKQVSTPPPPLIGVYPHITPEIEHVVMKALAKQPNQRYPTVTEFANALASAIQSSAYQLQNTPQQRTPPVSQAPAAPLQQQQNSSTLKSPLIPPVMPFNPNVMGPASPSPLGRAQPEPQFSGAPMPSPTPDVFTPPQQVNTPPEGVQSLRQPINPAPRSMPADTVYSAPLPPPPNQLPRQSFAAPPPPQQPLNGWNQSAPLPPPNQPQGQVFAASVPPSQPLNAWSAPLPPPNQPQGQVFAAPLAAPPPPRGWDQGHPYNAIPHGDETVSNLTTRSTLDEIKSEIDEFLSKPMESAVRYVETDVFFTHLPRYRWVFPLGVVTNLLGMFIYLFSAVSFLSWIPSIILAVIGFAISVFCLRQCLISVKKITAISYSVVIAVLWWIVIGTLFAHISPSSVLVASAIAFALSIAIHVWHVEARLKN